MRTPNTQCLICAKPLYRRPYEMVKVRYAACMEHRSEAQKVAGITEAQQAGLKLGRPKGTNHRTGYKHREESKRKASESHKAFNAANPDFAKQRGAKTRGELNVRWKGGSTRLNASIRQMTENRRWMDAVKGRDGCCVRCGSTDRLESHHKRSLANIIDDLGLKNRDDARRHAAVVWDLDNGETLCEQCHYGEHGRSVEPSSSPRVTHIMACKECSKSFAVKPSLIKKNHGKFCGRACYDSWFSKNSSGFANRSWKGGLVERNCLACNALFMAKPCVVKRGGARFCNRKCIRSFYRAA
jgi:hypothetical protein